MGEAFSRRGFLGSLGAGALLGVTGLQGQSSAEVAEPAAWSAAPVLKNPNILIVMVDQMRLPVWLSASQNKQLKSSIMPNIMGRIQGNSYEFAQFYCAATNCTPARSALLTGLYSPQTAMYITGAASGGVRVDHAGAEPGLSDLGGGHGGAEPGVCGKRVVVRQVASFGEPGRGAPTGVRI